MKPETQKGETPATGQQLGWGSNIENARLAHAAQLALMRGDYAVALDYAQRAAQSTPNNPQLWFLLGYVARLDGRYDESTGAFKHGLRLDPSSLSGMSGLAQTYSVMGRTAEAEQLLRQVLASDPRQVDDLMVLGNLCVESGDYTAALEWLEKAEQQQPNARVEVLMAISYEHLKQMDQASHYLDLARKRAPNNPDVERSLAGYYRATGDYGKAIDELNAIRTRSPEVVAELADTYQLDGKAKDSAQLYEQAANAMPKDLQLQLSAAQAEVSAGSMESANSFLARATQIDPNYYRLQAIRGEIAQQQDRFSEAANDYARAVEQLPASPSEGPLYGIQLHMDLEELYGDLNEPDRAREQFQIAQAAIGKLDERGTARPAFLRLRALIRMKAGQPASALEDAREALALNPHDPNNLQLDGDVLMKLDRAEDAITVYKKVLAIDPRNRFALTSLGYASRAAGKEDDAERYFDLLAKDYPSSYISYLALGDLYTARREYRKAQESYSRGYALNPQIGLIVAGGINAGIEAHNLTLAGMWQHRVTANMEAVPEVLREEERYFSFKGDYGRSAGFGQEAIRSMPDDRDVVVYLGYDFLYLNKYEQLLALTKQYDTILPHEPDIPLLAGYVEKHDGHLEEALQDFTKALDRDSSVETAYVNRGYVLNSLHRPGDAAASFEQALQREPRDGQAHLGLAYAELDLDHPEAAIRQAGLAEEASGDSQLIHAIKATAYGREDMLTRAAEEYRAALRFTPNDPVLHLGLGNTLFGERRYREAIDELLIAERMAPADPQVDVLLARTYANLQDRQNTYHYVQLAEQRAAAASRTGNAAEVLSETYMATGQALSALGDQQAAMERFSDALAESHSNRAGIRLAIAQLMTQQGNAEGAERQIALAQMEAEAGDAKPVTGNQYVDAADVLRQLHEYQLSQNYLQRAQAAGAPDIPVRVGFASNYLAVGDTARAAAELAGAAQDPDSQSNYQFLLAEANVYQQEHRGPQALSAFAQAANAAGDDPTAMQGLLQAGGDEGYRINGRVSALSDFAVQPIYEDSTVYVLDAKTFGNPPAVVGNSVNVTELPRPRSSIETQWTAAYHLHLGNLATPAGFFQIRNARGTISDPATLTIVNRSTTDFVMNFGVNPTLRFGSNDLTFNSGIQGTIRRDSISPVQMDQNLFRVFTYVQTTSFMNAVSASGYVIRETGPFTRNPIDETSLAGAIDFRVGAPWGKTALITGWGMNDQDFAQHFAPSASGTTENYYTSSYIGLSHRFAGRLNTDGLVEDLRTWRVVPSFTSSSGNIVYSGTAQALRPAAQIDFTPARNWEIQANGAFESTRSFHLYDLNQDGISLAFTLPFSRTFNDETGEVRLRYPIRFSGGIQAETFSNFPDLPSVPGVPYLTQTQDMRVRPYVSINIF